MKPLFTPENLSIESTGYMSPTFAAKQAQQIFTEWLQSQIVVYGYDNSMNGWYEGKDRAVTHTARLICIEELKKEPCRHDPRWTNQIPGWHHGPGSEVACYICGVKLKARWEAADESYAQQLGTHNGKPE